jgi:drug/metabolite transporter (DMT)-like permease
MAAVLAATSALVFGAADFLGGVATRRAPVLAVVAVSQLAGLVVLGAMLPLLDGAPSGADLAWGGTAGLAGGTGLLLFYRALAAGVMSVVAPVTATLAAGVPVLAGLAQGERPGALALTGVAVALLATALVSRGEDAAAPGAPVPLAGALGAGLAFGAFFVLLDRTAATAGLWPLLPARCASLALIFAAAASTRRTLRPTPRALLATLGAGVLDMTANVLYLLAVQRGLLSLVAVLASLYPVSTLLLARTLLGERLRGVQGAGVAFALAAIVLITLP